MRSIKTAYGSMAESPGKGPRPPHYSADTSLRCARIPLHLHASPAFFQTLQGMTCRTASRLHLHVSPAFFQTAARFGNGLGYSFGLVNQLHQFRARARRRVGVVKRLDELAIGLQGFRDQPAFRRSPAVFPCGVPDRLLAFGRSGSGRQTPMPLTAAVLQARTLTRRAIAPTQPSNSDAGISGVLAVSGRIGSGQAPAGAGLEVADGEGMTGLALSIANLIRGSSMAHLL
jgi:hypothetical protein